MSANLGNAPTDENNPLAWQDDAPCSTTDPEVFFPEPGESAASAKSICGECDVRERCLLYALEQDEKFGIWGGLTASERRRLLTIKPVPVTEKVAA